MNDAWLKKTITLWVQILRIRVIIIQKNRHSRAYQETDILLCHFPSWLEGKLLSFLTLLFHKLTNTDLLFLKHFTPHRPSSDPSSSPSVHSLSFPILLSFFLSLLSSLPFPPREPCTAHPQPALLSGVFAPHPSPRQESWGAATRAFLGYRTAGYF